MLNLFCSSQFSFRSLLSIDKIFSLEERPVFVEQYPTAFKRINSKGGQFGLKVTLNGAKYVVFVVKNSGEKLIYNLNRYKEEVIKDLDDSVEVWCPYYDNYLYVNLMSKERALPLSNIKGFLAESHGLPFEPMLNKAIKETNLPVLAANSVYYENPLDFDAYLAYRIILASDRGTIEKPQLEHFSRDNFCLWLNRNDREMAAKTLKENFNLDVE